MGVSSDNYSVILNGRLRGTTFFIPFVIVVHCLRMLLKGFESTGFRILFDWWRFISLSHLQFIDETLVFFSSTIPKFVHFLTFFMCSNQFLVLKIIITPFMECFPLTFLIKKERKKRRKKKSLCTSCDYLNPTFPFYYPFFFFTFLHNAQESISKTEIELSLFKLVLFCCLLFWRYPTWA